MDWRLIGNLTLYTLIGFSVCMLIIMAIRKAWYWFTVFSGIAACVVIGEGVSFLVVHKSISSQYGDWLNAQPGWAWSALLLFFLAMCSLVIHLAAYGFKEKKKT